jgi:nucleoside-diphosphate-sugar epimerase
MKVLITGNMGYVGPVLICHLRSAIPNLYAIGYDSGFFAHCLTTREHLPEIALGQQVFGDIRDLAQDVLEGVDAVVHLAAVSNDPMGNRFEGPTDEINFRASVQLAQRARCAGVKHFVFASSCSIYGFSEEGARKETDALNPLTAYARSKIATERALAQLDLGDMIVTCLRFATACGMSPRLRLDLVLNDFVACAISSKEVTVLSDGSPWRPLIDVSDMARAIEWAITRDASCGGRFLAVNAGADEWNHQVRDLADAVALEIPGTRVSVNPDAPPDRRSYRVDFSLFRTLAPRHQPRMTVPETVRGIRDGLLSIGFADQDFRNSDQIRLKVLDRFIRANRLASNLRWSVQPAGNGIS